MKVFQDPCIAQEEGKDLIKFRFVELIVHALISRETTNRIGTVLTSSKVKK